MPAYFTSGWLGNGERAWHGEGVVTDGTLPAREAFETANALFTVEKRELTYPVFSLDAHGMPDTFTHKGTGSFGIIRTDTDQLLGIVSKQYEMVQNEALLRMADFIREEVDMDSVVVLSDGAKVAFTATLRGATQEVVPGDSVKRRIVGYLGHDGKTGCGAIFTNVRVVCSNTLAAAMGSKNKVSIRHKTGANASFDSLISSIDVAREAFTQEIDAMRELADTQIDYDTFKEYLERVYEQEIPDGKQLSDLRKYPKLLRCYHIGNGSEFASNSLWNAVNAVTEVETSTKIGYVAQTAAQQRRQFAKANFGSGLDMSRQALKVATGMLAEVG